MTHLVYLAILAACLLAPITLELVLRIRLRKRWRQVLLAVAPVLVAFTGWIAYAVHADEWTYNRRYVLGWFLPGRLPVEELLFLIVIPLCAIATFEAVRRRRPQWTFGDEADPR